MRRWRLQHSIGVFGDVADSGHGCRPVFLGCKDDVLQSRVDLRTLKETNKFRRPERRLVQSAKHPCYLGVFEFQCDSQFADRFFVSCA